MIIILMMIIILLMIIIFMMIVITSSVEAGIVGGQVLSDSLLFRATVQELIKLALSKYLKLSLS